MPAPSAMIVAIAMTCAARLRRSRADHRSQKPIAHASLPAQLGDRDASVGRSVGDDASAAQLDDAIGDPRDLAVVRDDEHRATGLGAGPATA